MLKKIKYILDKSLELLVTVAMAVLVVDVVWQVFYEVCYEVAEHMD